MIRPITSRQHGMLDYPAGILLVLAPWIFAFHDQSNAATVVPVVIGAAIIGMSLFTDYEWSLVDALPMAVHVTTDLLAGVVLAVSRSCWGSSTRASTPGSPT
jgi:hypothetical protein